ncbi:MAG: dephospho-CoA kinase [Bacteroidales bacterium]|nr:dephospho-CoA kinase [Bacteroidales bacterium]
MLKIGVTGGIGSGKTQVCSIISAMGYPIFNADLVARRIVEEDSKIIMSIKEVFGDNIYSNGLLNRKRVAELVFSNPKLLETLNYIVHPAVKDYFNNWVLNYHSRSLVVEEAAILFESDTYKDLDKIIVVSAPLEVRINRVKKRDGMSREAILNRINSQLHQEELIKRGDYIIENDEVQLILPQIVVIINDLLKDSL